MFWNGPNYFEEITKKVSELKDFIKVRFLHNIHYTVMHITQCYIVGQIKNILFLISHILFQQLARLHSLHWTKLNFIKYHKKNHVFLGGL